MKCPDDYNVVMMPFPGDILACVRVNADGYPTVYINDYLSTPAKRDALRHELWHFANGDFTSHWTIYDVEKAAAQTVRLNAMPRAYKRLTDEEYIRLERLSLSLMRDAYETMSFDEPVRISEPMFYIQPERNLIVRSD